MKKINFFRLAIILAVIIIVLWWTSKISTDLSIILFSIIVGSLITELIFKRSKNKMK